MALDGGFKMVKVLFLSGLPASGKSTWARAYCEKNTDWIRVSRDDLRSMRGKYWLPAQEKLITEMEKYCIIAALNKGYNIVIDATHLNQKNLAGKTQFIKEYCSSRRIDIQFETKTFDLSVEKCIERDLKRANSVGEKVIRKFYDLYLKPVIQSVEYVEGLPSASICDLDGTICLHNGRNPFDYDRCDKDLPNEPVIRIVENYLSEGQNQVIFMSGREDRCKEKSIQWIKKHVQVMDKELKIFMRKTGDHRKDSIVKRELFDENIRGKYNIDFILDDRLQVCRMWYALGLTVLRVGNPDADF